jgi:hypothetical protein
MSAEWIAFEIFANLSYGILWCYFIVKYFGFKEHIKAKYLLSFLFSLILCGIISMFNYFVIYEGFLISIYSLVIFIFAVIFLNGNLWEKLLVSILKQVILVGIAFIIPMLVSLMVEENIANMMISEFSIFRFIIIVLIFVIYLLILKLILYLKKEFHEMTKHQWFMIILLTFISLILIISIMEIILTITTNKSYYFFLVVSVTSIISLNILIYIFMGILNRNNKLIAKYQLENQQKLYEEKNMDNIKNMYEKIRILNHDHANHMQLIAVLLEKAETKDSNIDEAINYIKNLDEKIKSSSTAVSTGNYIVDAIVSAKLALASSYDIKFEYNISIPESLPFADTDLCAMLSNLLDNAIEACRKLKDGSYIDLEMLIIKNQFNILLSNSTNGEYIRDGNKFRTTKQNQWHGIGMKQIGSIVNEYSGLYDIDAGDNLFTTRITIPLAKKKI